MNTAFMQVSPNKASLPSVAESAKLAEATPYVDPLLSDPAIMNFAEPVEVFAITDVSSETIVSSIPRYADTSDPVLMSTSAWVDTLEECAVRKPVASVSDVEFAEKLVESEVKDMRHATLLPYRLPSRPDPSRFLAAVFDDSVVASVQMTWTINGVKKQISIPTGKNLRQRWSVLNEGIISLMDRINACLEAQGRRLNYERTKNNLINEVWKTRQKGIYDKLSYDQRQFACTAAQYLLLLEVTSQQGEVAQKLFSRLAVATDDSRTWIESERTCDSISTRMQTMISPNAPEFELRPIFKFTMSQLCCLRDFMFHREPGARLRAKVDLLSSVREDVKRDVMLHPWKSFVAGCFEYGMSTIEFLDVVFMNLESRTAAPRCVNCQTTVRKTSHGYAHECEVVRMIVNRRPDCAIVNKELVVKSMITIDNTVAMMAQELMAKQLEKRTIWITPSACNITVQKPGSSRLKVEGTVHSTASTWRRDYQPPTTDQIMISRQEE